VEAVFKKCLPQSKMPAATGKQSGFFVIDFKGEVFLFQRLICAVFVDFCCSGISHGDINS